MASVFTRRVIAYILDIFVISSVMWILAYLCYMMINPYETYGVYKNFAMIVPILIIFYFVLCEKLMGATIGKSLMYLQVRSRNGARISWAQAIVRNLTKIYWFPVIFDWLVGKFLRTDRLFGAITRTVVINEL